MRKYILLVLVQFIVNNSFSQVNRTNAKSMDTCKLNLHKTKNVNKEQVSDSIFKINCNCKESIFNLKFFNRWGKIIYILTDINQKINWKDLPNGTLFWVIEVTYPNGKREKISDFIEITD